MRARFGSPFGLRSSTHTRAALFLPCFLLCALGAPRSAVAQRRDPTPRPSPTMRSDGARADSARADSLTRAKLPALAGRSVLALSPVVAAAERVFSAASARSARALDLALRPRASTQQLLAVAPGLVVAQHAGGGKAEQIFLRGFDADHGTDVAVSVDGTPVNLVSHAHGHGYADLHFVPPDLVERVEVRKGTYDARDGDLATAGAITLRTRDRVAGPSFTAGVASFGERTLSGAIPFGSAAGAGGYLYGSIGRSDGPFDVAQQLRRSNLFARWTAPLGADTRVRATLSAYDAKWRASGQVPRRAVASGVLSRFGAIDPSEGGATSRYEVNASIHGGRAAEWSARAWLVRYDLELFSNFTFFAHDDINGDGIVQRDRRTAAGLDARVARTTSSARTPVTYEAGAGVRVDAADVLLARQRARVEGRRITNAHVQPLHAYAWTGEALQLSERLHANLGVRADLFRFAARELDPTSGNDDAPSTPDEDVAYNTAELMRPRARGTRHAALVSPKLSLRFHANDATQLFANAGTGFHSNDARDALLADEAHTIVPRALGAELGVRHTRERVSMAAALWWLDLDSELVYVGDEGTTEAAGRSRRTGIDVEARVQLHDKLWADGDINLARGRLRDEQRGSNYIPLAPSRTATTGLTLRDAGPLSTALRVRHVAARPADESATISARGHTLADVFAELRLERAQLRVSVENALNAEWNEAQFATTSRLRGEMMPVTDLHFTPGSPRSVRIELSWRF